MNDFYSLAQEYFDMRIKYKSDPLMKKLFSFKERHHAESFKRVANETSLFLDKVKKLKNNNPNSEKYITVLKNYIERYETRYKGLSLFWAFFITFIGLLLSKVVGLSLIEGFPILVFLLGIIIFFAMRIRLMDRCAIYKELLNIFGMNE